LKDFPDVFVVTGASGFIGRAAVSALARRDMPVLAVSRRTAVFDPPVRPIIVKDYLELELPTGDAVLIHLAEPRDIGAVDNTDEVYVAERRAIMRILLAKGWGHVVYASSAAVYGDHVAVRHRTGDAVNPQSGYAEAKAACELDVLTRGGTVARLSNVYGPRMAPNNVISDILRQIPGKGPLTVSDRRPLRDYLWIDDAGEGLAALAISGKSGVFNLGTGIGISVGDLAHAILECAGQSGREVYASAASERTSHLVLDISETIKELGWTPKVTLAQGLAHLIGAA
jgi:nucleoside-diphosphate-sugar epimerase